MRVPCHENTWRCADTIFNLRHEVTFSENRNVGVTRSSTLITSLSPLLFDFLHVHLGVVFVVCLYFSSSSSVTLFAACFLFVSCVTHYSSTQEMEAVCCSETSLNFYQTTRRYIPEHSTFHSHHYENFKSNIVHLRLFYQPGRRLS
jgi:hypothetical protein